MSVSLHTFVDLYARALRTADHLLVTGAAFAREKGVSEADMLSWRLIDDMMPFGFQIMVVCNFARQLPERVAGLPVAPDVSADRDVAGFRAAIADALAALAAITPEKFAGRDDAPITFTIGTGMTPTMPASQWLTVFATTNLYFHLSTAYGILRARGAPIGKVDLFASGL